MKRKYHILCANISAEDKAPIEIVTIATSETEAAQKASKIVDRESYKIFRIEELNDGGKIQKG